MVHKVVHILTHQHSAETLLQFFFRWHWEFGPCGLFLGACGARGCCLALLRLGNLYASCCVSHDCRLDSYKKHTYTQKPTRLTNVPELSLVIQSSVWPVNLHHFYTVSIHAEEAFITCLWSDKRLKSTRASEWESDLRQILVHYETLEGGKGISWEWQTEWQLSSERKKGAEEEFWRQWLLSKKRLKQKLKKINKKRQQQQNGVSSVMRKLRWGKLAQLLQCPQVSCRWSMDVLHRLLDAEGLWSM